MTRTTIFLWLTVACVGLALMHLHSLTPAFGVPIGDVSFLWIPEGNPAERRESSFEFLSPRLLDDASVVRVIVTPVLFSADIVTAILPSRTGDIDKQLLTYLCQLNPLCQ